MEGFDRFQCLLRHGSRCRWVASLEVTRFYIKGDTSDYRCVLARATRGGVSEARLLSGDPQVVC